MTWALVQKSAAVTHTTTGTAAATLPAAATAGTLLIAQLGASGSAGTWSAPANWVITLVAANGATVNNQAVAWLLPADNPGGQTSFSFTFGTTTMNAQVAEFSFTAGAAVTVSASGLAAGGAVASLAVSTGTAAAAGDLAVCGFQEHLTASAVTWTDPSGWTALTATTASSGNQEYAGYNLSASAGTLTVTGTSSVASTLATGWTGLVVTFTAASVGTSAPAGLAGGTGTAQPTAFAYAPAGAPAASGAVPAGTAPAISVITGLARGTGTAAVNGTPGSTSAPAGLAGGTGTAQPATAFTYAPAGLAAASGASPAAAVSSSPAVVQAGLPSPTAYSTVAGSNTATNTWSATQPRTAGDLLVMVITASASGGITVPDPPAGWMTVLTVQNDPAAAAPSSWTGIFALAAAGGDAAPSLAITTSGATRIGTTLFELAGAYITAPVDCAGVYASGAAAATISSVSMSTAAAAAVPGGFAIAAYTRAQGTAATAIFTPGAGFTGLSDDGAVSSAAHNAVSYQAAVPAGTAVTSAASWTSAGSAYGAGGAAVFAAGPPQPYVIASTTMAAGAASYPGIAVTSPAGLLDGVTVAIATGGTSPPSVASVTDSRGNSYTLAQQAPASPGLSVWTSPGIVPLIPGTDTFTVTFTGPATGGSAFLAAGTPGLNLADISITASGSSGTPGAAGTAGPLETGLAFFAWGNSGGAGSVGGGFSPLAQVHPAGGTYLTAASVSAAAGGTILAPAAAITPGTWHAVLLSFSPWQMSASAYIHNMYAADTAGAASHFYDSPSALAISTNQGSTGILDGFACTPVLKYTSYYQFKADLTGTTQTTLASISVPAKGTILAAYKWLMYDTENWGNTTSPAAANFESQEEVDDPWTWMASFVTLAHANGFKVIIPPARDLASSATTTRAKRSGESLDNWMIRTGIYYAAAAAGAEIIEVQAQADQATLTAFSAFYNSASAQMRSASGTVITAAGVSTTYDTGAGATMAAAASSVLTAGYWNNAITTAPAVGFIDLMLSPPGTPVAAGLAAGSGIALTASASTSGAASAAAGLATAAGSALNATVSTTGSISAPAGLAAAAGTALPPFFPGSSPGLTRRIHGRSGVAYLSATSGAAASPVAFLSGWEIGWTLNPIDTTVLTDTQHLYTAGQPASAGSFTGFYDTATAQTYAAAADGLPRNMYLYPSTASTGQFFSGQVLPDYALSGSVTGAVRLAVSWSSAGLVAATGL